MAVERFEGSPRSWGIHRRMVREAVLSAVPLERRTPVRERPKLQPAMAFVDAILAVDHKATEATVYVSVQRLLGFFVPMLLVLDGHCVRVDGLLASNAFQSGEDATIIVFVALHRKSAFCFPGGPRQADVVFL